MLVELAYTAVAFGAASYTLRRWPLLLHSRKPHHPTWCGRVWSIGHRGGRTRTPENTLAGFKRSIGKVDAIELDVWLTKDGEVAVLHDGTLERVTGLRGHISGLDSKQLPAVQQQASDGHAQGEGQPQIPEAERRIPLLKEVLVLVRDAKQVCHVRSCYWPLGC